MQNKTKDSQKRMNIKKVQSKVSLQAHPKKTMKSAVVRWGYSLLNLP